MMQMLQQGMGGVNNFYSPYGSVPPPPSPGLYYSPPGYTSNDSWMGVVHMAMYCLF